MPTAELKERRAGATLFRILAKPGVNEVLSVDREARVIKGYAVITRGEALGHDEWVDVEALNQVVSFGNSAPVGIKSRFTHPGMCSDGLGKYLGRAKNFRLDGDVVRADMHFAKVASKTPDGDLAGYVMDMAIEDPQAFGTSIVFYRDRESESTFRQQNQKNGNFVTPDPENKRNLPHIRVAVLRASDVVDDPAANEGGFFSEGGENASRAEQVLSWLTGNAPAPSRAELGGMEPERVKVFFNGFLDRHSLSIGKKVKEQKMATQTCPECGHEWEVADKDEKSTGKPGAKLNHDCVSSWITSLSLDQARKLIEGRADLVAALKAEGKAEERQYRQDFTAALTAAGVTGEEALKFSQKYDGRSIEDVKEFAALTAGKRAQPVGEGGAAPVEIPEAGGGKTVDVAGEAKKRFAEDKNLRKSRNVLSADPASAEWKTAEDKYVKAAVAMAEQEAKQKVS